MPEIQWQPLSMLPTLIQLAAEALVDSQENLTTFREAQDRPGVLDQPTIERSLKVYTEQRDFLAIYAAQGQRWQQDPLTAAQHTQLTHLLTMTADASAITTALLAILEAAQAAPAVRPRSGAATTALTAAANALAMGHDKKARALMDAALAADPDRSPAERAELYTMRGTALADLDQPQLAIADYRQALALSEHPGSDDPLRLHRLLGLLAQAVVWEDPEEALTLYTREEALIRTHQAVILWHPDHRPAAVMAALGLALTNEMLERWDTAHQWYREAQRRCPAARVKPNQRLYQMCLEGLERVAEQV